MNGIYAGYFTAIAGSGMAMFVLKDGILAGADHSGVTFDGVYQPHPEGNYVGTVKVVAPPGATLIQGITAGPEGLVYEVPITFSETMAKEPYFTLKTPLGPVNVKMNLLREIG